MKYKSIRKIYVAGVAMLAMMFSGCSDERGNESEELMKPIQIELTRSESRIAEGFNEFSFDLFQKLNAEHVSGEKNSSDKDEDLTNFVISPFGVAWGFAMMANGVSDDGALQEILTTLHLENETTAEDLNSYCGKITEAFSTPQIRSQLKLSSAFFHKSGIEINEGFLSALKSSYDAKIMKDPTNDDFDSWISESTGGMIKDFAGKNDFARSLFGVLNNLQLNGIWAEPFEEKDTKVEPFRNSDGTYSDVRMMKSGQSMIQASDEKCRLVKLYFRGGSIAISFLVPQKERGLDDMIASLDNERWNQLLETSESGENYVKIPKFEHDNDLDLKERVASLGINRLFSNDNLLRKVNPEIPLLLTILRQATAIKLDESGVKAAAVSFLSGEYTGAKPYVPPFAIEESFCYVLTEESTGAILLMGKVGKL